MSRVLAAFRPLVVTFGGSLALDGAALASLRALRRRPRPRWALAGAGLTALYRSCSSRSPAAARG